ncbi:MAG: GNAT family N-acetyltransferase [Deltaproteobacteria bacterium]|nr:GNAT family N-acetyltransferase [Deltaproteobacteria bacterium]
MKIEAIGKEDLEAIRTLWEGLNAHHLARSTYFKDHYSTFTFERRMEVLVRRDLLFAYIAQDDDRTIGYCIATVDGSAGEVDSLFVDAACRGRGIGEALMSRALERLEAQNCETVRVSIAEGNEDALGFYRRFGFAERLTVMQRRQGKVW